jgi:hypothetical protein
MQYITDFLPLGDFVSEDINIKIRAVEAAKVPRRATLLVSDPEAGRKISQSLGIEVHFSGGALVEYRAGDIIYLFQRDGWRQVEVRSAGKAINRLTPHLIDAITMYMSTTEDPDEITDGLEDALLAGGMTYNDIAYGVERFLPTTHIPR